MMYRCTWTVFILLLRSFFQHQLPCFYFHRRSRSRSRSPHYRYWADRWKISISSVYLVPGAHTNIVQYKAAGRWKEQVDKQTTATPEHVCSLVLLMSAEYKAFDHNTLLQHSHADLFSFSSSCDDCLMKWASSLHAHFSFPFLPDLFFSL